MNTSRCAILPYPGDPFLLEYWLSFYDKYWGDEVDQLLIYLNSPTEKVVVDYIFEKVNEINNGKIHILYNNQQIQHGDAINNSLSITNHKHIMLIEDDFFVFRSGYIDKAFEKLESGEKEIIGSKRGSCSIEILKAASEKYGIKYEGYGDQGCNFWPSAFFCSRHLLLRTDRNFNAKQWEVGEEVPFLGTFDVPVNGDTFVNTSLFLRGIVDESKIMYIPQYHGHPEDLKHAEKNEYLFDGYAPWVHVGSLSSGVSGILTDREGRPLARRHLDPPKDNDTLPRYCNTEMERKEFERRVQWWLTFWEYAKPTESIKEYYELYGEAVQRIIRQYRLRIKDIRRRQKVYEERLLCSNPTS